jgi:hypothetical protein
MRLWGALPFSQEPRAVFLIGFCPAGAQPMQPLGCCLVLLT